MKYTLHKEKGERQVQDVLEFVSRNAAEGKIAALVTVTGTSGSSPATPGQMMAVLADGSTKGTIGGGASENHVVKQAVEAIKNGETVFSFSIDHAENGMICGGGMEGFGNIIGNNTGLCIFGGGHIAQSLAKIAATAGFSVTVVEDRPEFADDFEFAKYIICGHEAYEKLDPVTNADYAVICTRGHRSDDEALRYCMTKDLKYIGMIGSKTKVKALFTGLRSEGVTQAELDIIYAPIGLDIASAIPAEIAVAILAEILLIKNNGNLRHKKMYQ